MLVEELQIGTIVYDPNAITVPRERRFFRVHSTRDAVAGPWILETVANRAHRTVMLGQVEGLELVDPTPFVTANFDGLIGKAVRFRTRWGSWISGVIGSVEYYEFELGGEAFRLPDNFLIGEERFNLKEIKEMQYVDGKAAA